MFLNSRTNFVKRDKLSAGYFWLHQVLKKLSESIKNIHRKFGVQVYFRGGTTIKNLLMTPKDEDPIQKQSGVIYRYQCDRVDCDEEYIRESSRTFGERFKEHLKPRLPYMITATSLVTMLPSTISILLGGRT